MTPEDRELLQTLRREQGEFRRALAHLDAKLAEVERRLDADVAPPSLPFVEPSASRTEQASLPPLPPDVSPSVESQTPLPEPPPFASLPPVPPVLHELPPLPAAPKASLESRVGRWLTRLGALFFILFLVSADAYFKLHELLGPWGKLGLMGLGSMILLTVGQRLERRTMLVYGRTLLAAGLAGLYFTFYAATSVDALAVVRQPLVAGVLLLSWSVYAFHLATRRRSELVAVFAITLAYLSTALNPLVGFTLVADLLLAVTAVLFQLRYGWATLSFFALAGTYLALLRRLIVGEDGVLLFDTSRGLAFAPPAGYLAGAWLIFTLAALAGRSAEMVAAKRFVFLTLNNGLAAALLVLTAYISGYGADRMGDMLVVSGFLLLGTCAIAALARPDAPQVSGAYLAQGLALVTGGIMAVYTGATRAVILLVETLFLGQAGVFGRSRILRVGAWVTAFFTTLFLLWEIGVEARDPWVLGLGGAAVMFKNARGARRDLPETPEAETMVLSASYYCTLGLGLIYGVLATQMEADALPVALALVALLATFSVHLLRLHELPPLAQAFLLAALALVLDPGETGETLSGWTTAMVAAATLAAIFWWAFQRVTRRGPWLQIVDFLYALALVALVYQRVRPHLHEQLWMIEAALLSSAFLGFGALTRVWSLAAMGQVLLGLSLYHYFQLNADPNLFPWSAWAAAIPLAVVWASARGLHGWLRAFPALGGESRRALRLLAHLYQLVALLMLVRLLLGLVTPVAQPAVFLLMGTVVLTSNARRGRVFGVRCSYVLSGLGVLLYAAHFEEGAKLFATFSLLLAVLSFLTQPANLDHAAKRLGAAAETWGLVLVSTAMGWLFFSGSAAARWGHGTITVSWAVFALVLFLFGLTLQQQRQRWCALAILFAAVARVFAVDFWGLSNGLRVLTFVVLTVVTLGLGFIYARYADRLKTLL